MTADDIARIPLGNLRVPREEFVALWTAAERASAEQSERGVIDWRSSGVAQSCAWLAGAPLRLGTGAVVPRRSPVTERTASAYEELIEAELIAAERLAMRTPRPQWVSNRPGWIEAVCATLKWVWRHGGPVSLPAAAVRTSS